MLAYFNAENCPAMAGKPKIFILDVSVDIYICQRMKYFLLIQINLNFSLCFGKDLPRKPTRQKREYKEEEAESQLVAHLGGFPSCLQQLHW